jgi:hypothetical protein
MSHGNLCTQITGTFLPSRDRGRHWLTIDRFYSLIRCCNISESCPSAAHERTKTIFVGNTVGLSWYREAGGGPKVLVGVIGVSKHQCGSFACIAWPHDGSTDAADNRRCQFNTRPVPSSQPWSAACSTKKTSRWRNRRF